VTAPHRNAAVRAADDGKQETWNALGTAGDSFSVAAWTLVSRLTGVLRVAAVGAVLGPTLLGNTFQLTNSLPNLVFYGFLAGSLFCSLLVPALGRPLASGDRRGCERIAGGFLGVALLTLTVAAALGLVLGPLVLRVGAIGTGLDADRVAQERVGSWLLLMVMPQVLLYAVVGSSVAAMHASRRFALAAAAPALENLGILSVLGVTALMYSPHDSVRDVPAGELVLLGVGATAAVTVHAAAQWWGAHHAGITLIPRAGWRDPDVIVLVRRAVSAMGVAGLAALQMLTLLALANRVPGGVVAVQMGLTFYFVVIALVGSPVALSLLPRLAQLHHQGAQDAFRGALQQGLSFALFLTVPAATGLLALATPLAHVMAVGRMGSESATALVSTTIVALVAGILAETVFLVASYACYARDNVRAPLRSMLLQALTFMPLALATLLLADRYVVASLALAFSASGVVGAGHLVARLRREIGRTTPPLTAGVLRVGLGALAMSAPVWLVGQLVPAWVGGRIGSALGVVVATAVGATVYLLVQRLWRAPELRWMNAGLSRLRPGKRRSGPRARTPQASRAQDSEPT
jgi:putative peptidoglycan lipid II flippase